MKFVKQPYKSKMCGHCCIAMVANITIGKAIQLVGHKNGTNTGELIKVLRRLNISCSSGLLKLKERPTFAIAKIPASKNGGKFGHWVVLKDNVVYCPTVGVKPLSQFFVPISSYLVIDAIKK